jgi:hypothetical protein
MTTAYAFDPIRRPAVPGAWEAPRPELQVVGGRALSKPRVLAAGLLMTGVTGILVAQLLISIQTSSGAYTVDRLQATSTTLARQQQVRAEAIETLASPQDLARRATALGMVPAAYPAYLRLSDGAVVGGPGRAAAAGSATLGDVPNALLSASR